MSEKIKEMSVLHGSHWEQMKNIIFSEWDYKKIKLSPDLEFRFFPMPKQSYSALLSFQGQDVFHFMWTEVDGMIDITHRIVHKDFRGLGIATSMMKALEDRAQQLADAKQVPFNIMIDTSQISVINLGKKCGMKISKGQEILNNIEKYIIDENTHVLDENSYQMMFRLSKRIIPTKKSEFEIAQSYTRINILQVLAAA